MLKAVWSVGFVFCCKYHIGMLTSFAQSFAQSFVQGSVQNFVQTSLCSMEKLRGTTNCAPPPPPSALYSIVSASVLCLFAMNERRKHGEHRLIKCCNFHHMVGESCVGKLHLQLIPTRD